MKRKIIFVVTLVFALALGLCIMTLNPIILYNTNIPDNYTETIDDQSKGVYSWNLPLIPIYVTVDSYSFNTVYYAIHYFPFGTVDMSYMGNGNYNIENSLH